MKIIDDELAYEEWHGTTKEYFKMAHRIFKSSDGKLRVYGRVRPNVIFEGAPLGKAIEL